MSESDNPLSSKVAIDVTNFKAGVTELNTQIRVIESGFKAAAAGIGDWDQSSDGLELRIKSLTSTIGLQQQKVDGLKRVYQEMADGGKASNKELELLTITINKETERLNTMQGDLNGSKTALDGMGNESKDAAGQVEDLGKKEDGTSAATDKLKGKSSGLGAALKTLAAGVAGVVVGVAGIGVGVGKMVLGTAAASDNLDELSQKTGISTDRLQELQFIAGQSGTDFDTMTGSMAKLVRSMDAGQKATSPAGQAFAELGINVTDSNGKLRDSKVVWEEAIAALGKIPDETERDRVSMALFGKSAQELNPLILAGSAGMADMAQQAHDLGAVMSKEDILNAAELNDQLDGLKKGLQGTVMEVSMAFIPAFAGIATKAGGYLKTFTGIVKGSDGDLKKMTAGTAGLVKTIVTDIAGQAPKLLQGGLSIVQGIIQALVSSLPTLLPAIISMLTAIVQFIVENIPMILQAGIQILLALITGITGALPQLIPAIVLIIPQIITTLIDNLGLIIGAALQLVIALAQGLIAALPVLIPRIPEIVKAIFDAIILALPMIGQAALELLKVLVGGLVDNLPMIGVAAGKLIDALVQGIGGLAKSLWDVGKSIVEGVWQGIQSQADYFSKQISGFFTGIVDGIKHALGIASPSKVFAGIGQNMAAGLGVGFTDQFKAIERNIRGAVGGMRLGDVTVGVQGAAGSSAAAAGAASATNHISMGGIHITVQAGYNGDLKQIGKAAGDGVMDRLRAAGVI